MITYSAIILFSNSDEARKLAELQKILADKYLGKSAIHLPPHITLIRWKSKEPISNRLRSEILNKDVVYSVILNSKVVSKDLKSIWYKVAKSKEISHLHDQVRQILLDEGISQRNIIPNPKFHVTLAYKDYTENEILIISKYIDGLCLKGFSVIADKIAICLFSKDRGWLIMDL